MEITRTLNAQIPDIPEALRTVVVLWHSHTNTLVQLLQQDATHFLHRFKV